MTEPVEIYFGEAAKQQFDGDDEAQRLADIRAKQLRISTAQAAEGAKLMIDIMRMFQANYWED